MGRDCLRSHSFQRPKYNLRAMAIQNNLGEVTVHHLSLSCALRCSLSLLFIVLPCAPSLAAPLTPNSVLVSYGGSDFIAEFSRTGEMLQSLRVPHPRPDATGGSEFVRDIERNADGSVSMFNGTFQPYLTTWNPTDGSFTHDTLTGWSSDGNMFFGNLGSYKNFVFASDNTNYYDSTSGVVRFDRSNPGSAQRFDSINPARLSVGADNLLYVLGDDLSTVQVFDPDTMALLRTITLALQVYSVTADRESHIIGAWNMGGLVKFDAEGKLLSTRLGAGLGDIDVGEDDTVLGRGLYPSEGVFFTYADLNTDLLFLESGIGFVAFGGPATPNIAINEPPTVALLLFIGLLSARRWVRSPPH